MAERNNLTGSNEPKSAGRVPARGRARIGIAVAVLLSLTVAGCSGTDAASNPESGTGIVLTTTDPAAAADTGDTTAAGSASSSGSAAESGAESGATTAPGSGSTGQEEGSAVTPPEAGAPGSVADRSTLAPVPLEGEAEVSSAQSVVLRSIEAVDGEAVIPGEVGGPALRVTVESSNTSDIAIDTPAVVVNLYYGPDRIPAGSLLNPGGQEFPSSIAPGNTATGVYVFTVPVDQRDNVLVEVDVAVEEPVVLFEGAIS